MRLRFASAALVTSCVLLATGCQSQPETTPAPTTPPPPPASNPPQTRHLAPGFTGLYFIPGQPLVLAEGSSVFVDINWVGGDVNWIGGDDFPRHPVSLRIVSDAPANELSVAPSSVEVGPGARNAGAIFLSALADERAGEAAATYTLEVQAEGPVAPGWAYDLSRARMQVTVVEGDPSTPVGEPSVAACDQTSLQAVAHGEARDAGSWMRGVHGEDVTHYFSGDIVLRATHPRTTASLLAPYRRPFAHREMEGGPPLYRPYPFGFLINLVVRKDGAGFEQSMSLAWFDDMHLRIDVPGCDAREAICEGGACRVR